jgi:2-polyprenyl-3-methyl-5-hydroxy-6-metoxy-1,4-benzoquinol methylase
MRDFTKHEFIGFWGNKGYIETWSGYEKDWTNEIMNVMTQYLTNESTVLEIGCGGGYWTNRIKPLCGTMYAIDLIPKPNIESQVIYIENENQEYKCKNIADNSIDFVFCFGVFCHLSLSACDEYLRDIVRVLKPNGKALLMYADETGLRKHFKNPTLTCEDVGWKHNTYAETMEMTARYPLHTVKVLEYRDTLLLLTKQDMS